MSGLVCTVCGDKSEHADEGERCLWMWGAYGGSRRCDGFYEVPPEWCCTAHEYGRSTLEPCRGKDDD